VDDNRANLEILRLQLAAWRMRVTGVESGEQALREMGLASAAGDPYVLALLDSRMPDMDGMQLARAIQARPELARTRLLLLGTGLDANGIQAGERAWITRVVAKPIRRAELHEALLAALAPAMSVSLAVTGADAAPRLHGHVLLAEDNPVNQEVGVAMLEGLGLTVDVADNGQETLAMRARCEYDLILMDCQMPVLDGFQATAEIRAREQDGAGRLPIVALTANAMAGDRDQCLAAGMDAYLAKPYTMDQLREVLRRWLPERTAAATAPVAMVEAAGDTTTPTTTPTTTRAVIDAPYLERLRELDPVGGLDLARKIMRVYLAASVEIMTRLEQALDAGDGESLRRAAHTLKSSSANVGAANLSALFKQLESWGIEADLEAARASIDAARQEYARVVNELHALLEETS
jgi:CheY-like chemotaxis protein/HPt (histidine-containing phosphotransfer) domain-containing protein